MLARSTCNDPSSRLNCGYRDCRADLDVGNTCCPCNPYRSVGLDGDLPVLAFDGYGLEQGVRKRRLFP